MMWDMHNVYATVNFAEGRKYDDILFIVNFNSMKTET
jgi:hypothetical protein